ncbi:uncharacterized protein LOC118203176 [Stegodyphus dumicola]|uniref:uncharacterized protein LOC118203176 n=1 Tax=Stegodyphus dumicola TaxID=202533 RepID=UPI0015A85934|nr:uncharacterized protein LOC118203176 [Stegodyphus dumicola]
MSSISSRFCCASCDCSFSVKSNLYRHIRNFHSEHKLETYNERDCTLCNERFTSMKELHDHIDSVHTDIRLNFQELIFHSKSEFENWKEDVEKSSQSFFAKRTTKRLADGTIRSYFLCNRSGSCKIKTDRIRHMKCGGSIKIGKTCPAEIKVSEKEIGDIFEIKVSYQSVHVGHRHEVGKLPLSKTEKSKLAGMMQQGIPKEKILMSIQSSYSPTKRIGVTHLKDLQNISRGIQVNNEIVFDTNDAVSVDLKVQKMKAESGCPILLYKKVGDELPGFQGVSRDDFLLGVMNGAQLRLLELNSSCIMIDSTHGMNQYGFQLTSVLLNDDNHEGFPVAILYSSKITAQTFILFFQLLKIEFLILNLRFSCQTMLRHFIMHGVKFLVKLISVFCVAGMFAEHGIKTYLK